MKLLKLISRTKKTHDFPPKKKTSFSKVHSAFFFQVSCYFPFFAGCRLPYVLEPNGDVTKPADGAESLWKALTIFF